CVTHATQPLEVSLAFNRRCTGVGHTRRRSRTVNANRNSGAHGWAVHGSRTGGGFRGLRHLLLGAAGGRRVSAHQRPWRGGGPSADGADALLPPLATGR